MSARNGKNGAVAPVRPLARPIWLNTYSLEHFARYTIDFAAFAGEDFELSAPEQLAALELDPHAVSGFLRLVRERRLSVEKLLTDAVSAMIWAVISSDEVAASEAHSFRYSEPWQWWTLAAKLHLRETSPAKEAGEEMLAACHERGWRAKLGPVADALCAPEAMLTFAYYRGELAAACWRLMVRLDGDSKRNVRAGKDARDVVKWAFEHKAWPDYWPLRENRSTAVGLVHPKRKAVVA